MRMEPTKLTPKQRDHLIALIKADLDAEFDRDIADAEEQHDPYFQDEDDR